MESRWRLPFTWMGLLAVAWVVYELTHQPALGAIAICLKFGWEDFHTAYWLAWHDASRWRRWSTFWLYVAWGLWKTAVVAFLMSFAFAAFGPRKAAPGVPQVVLVFLGTFLTTLTGFALSTLLTAVAVLCAWWGGVRLWLDSAVHRARRLDCWPPAPFCEGRTNRLGSLLLTGLGLGFLFVLLILLAAAPGGAGGFAICFFLSITAPVMMLVARELISRQVWAESPYECWHEPWWEEEAERSSLLDTQDPALPSPPDPAER
jgi:hypothetical protein